MSTRNLYREIQSASRKNHESIDKPNEDFAIVDNSSDIYIVCDGVSRSTVADNYPNPSPAACAARIFAQSTYDYLVTKLRINPEQSDLHRTLQSAIIAGNNSIALFNHAHFPSI